jgi:hypothetical protein
MIWPRLALISALCQSGQDLLARRLLRGGRLSSRQGMGIGSAVAAAAALVGVLVLALGALRLGDTDDDRRGLWAAPGAASTGWWASTGWSLCRFSCPPSPPGRAGRRRLGAALLLLGLPGAVGMMPVGAVLVFLSAAG